MNSIYRLKDKYEDGIKELKKEQKRKEPKYLRNRNIILIISGIIEIIVIITSCVYFLKTYDGIPMMRSVYISAITSFMIIGVAWRFQYEHENGWDRKLATNHYNKRINTLKKWKKDNRSNKLKKKIYIKLLLRLYCLKWMIWVTIVLGVILIGVVIIGLILLYSIFKFDEFYLAIMEVLSVVIMLAYLLWIASFLEKKPYNRRKKVTITDTDWKRVIFLKNLLEREKFCFDDIAKIQIIIDELTRMKRKVFPFVDINQFIIKPFIVIWIPYSVAFFNTVMKDTLIDSTVVNFFVMILTLVLSFFVLVFYIIYPIRYLLYGKYDALIGDLRLLQITKEEKENQ